jgi:hypothetical protein
MKCGIRIPIGISISLLFILSACSGGAGVEIEQSGEGVIGPQEIANATEVVKFDPASFPLDGREPAAGECAGSNIVMGTYSCVLEAGGIAEPCFPLDGARLLCDPDPVAETYDTLINATNPLPTVMPPSPDRTVVFFVELADGMTCAIRTTPEPVIIGGLAAGYDCDAPYTYLLGDQTRVFDRDAPVWRAGVYVLDPDTGQSPSGEIPKDILRAWIP